ncbi:universal stress protein [Kineosporia babensis]|uniref:Universal stress protein n=1 Tax=Kineosporia babensis TaxID=499548 RepID=A0A9X1STH4_9ACTN|nr:universal stress protein [Kineosporia babensis]MCD5311889.1 universal stress protein [Kineosporia babensis]
MYERVLVAVDGSECGDHAFGVARSLVSRDLGSELTVVHVAQLVTGRAGTTRRAAQDEELVERLQQSVAKLLAEGVKTQLMTPTTYQDGPAFAIAEVADQVDADVILIGSRGESSGAQAVLGEVPVQLLQSAYRPVMVIPMPRQLVGLD